MTDWGPLRARFLNHAEVTEPDWDQVRAHFLQRREELGRGAAYPMTMEVDGIVSWAWEYDDHVRPMFEIFPDHHHTGSPPSAWGRQRWDNPPTEEELDGWVKGTADVL